VTRRGRIELCEIQKIAAQTDPILLTIPEGREENGLQPSDGMSRREKVISHLLDVDDGAL
jgi:hypothetical protein